MFSNFVSKKIFRKMNPKSLEFLQTKALKMLVEIINGDVERSPEMMNTLLGSVRNILKFPYNGDYKEFLLKILKFFENGGRNIEILELIELFLSNSEGKSSLKGYFFKDSYSFLENFDFFRIYYDFLVSQGHLMVFNKTAIHRFFSSLETLIMKQRKPSKLNKPYFLKIFKFVYGNKYPLLKERFSDFIVENYMRFVRKFQLFPFLFSENFLHELHRVKQFYINTNAKRNNRSQLSIHTSNPPLVKRGSHDSDMKEPSVFDLDAEHDPAQPGPMQDLTMIDANPKEIGVETKTSFDFGFDEQLLFKLIFLIENSIQKEPGVKLLSNTLSDELFVTMSDLKDLKGFKELWYIVQYIPRTGTLMEFLVKLYRNHCYTHLVYYLPEGKSPNLTDLNDKNLTSDQKESTKNYRLSKNLVKVKETGSADNPLSKLVEKRFFELFNEMITKIKTGIEHQRQEVVQNILLMFRKVVLTFLGFLGEINIENNQTSLGSNM